MGDGDVLQFLSAFREAAPAVPRTPPVGPVVVPAVPRSAPEPEVAQTVDGAEVDPPPAATPELVEEGPWLEAPAPPVWAPPPAVGAGVQLPPAGSTTTWPGSPPLAPQDGRTRRTRMWERIAMASVLVATAAVLTLVAMHNGASADKWRRLDREQVAISTAAAQQIKTANANITELNSEVKVLDTQVSTVQGQLSSVANQKEKAIDQTTVLKDLLAAAGQVANHLQDCIAATNQLNADVNSAVGSGNAAALGPLQTEASAVAATCSQAQDGNNALQAAIQSAS